MNSLGDVNTFKVSHNSFSPRISKCDQKANFVK